MSSKCKGICKEWKKRISQARCFDGPRRYCIICEVWHNEEIRNCPCCGQQFRLKPRKKNRKKSQKPFLEYSVIEQIPKERKNRMIKKSVYITPEQENILESKFVNLSKYVRENLSKDFGGGPKTRFDVEGYL